MDGALTAISGLDRAHVHRTLDAHELPVHHETRRTGRPYTLVLTKTDVLFEQERRSRALDQRNLDWLLAPWTSIDRSTRS